MRVLVFPGGTETGAEIYKSLCQCKEVTLYSAGDARSSHAPFLFARHHFVPSLTEAGWMDALKRVIVDHAIDFVYPAYDDALVALAQNLHRLGARVVASPLRTCTITRSKAQTYDLLTESLPVPIRFATPDDVPEYPVFVKPDRGHGSRGTSLVWDRAQLECVLAHRDGTWGELLICEYLPGEEFTVDCFNDRAKGLLYCGARRRERTRAGIAMRSVPVTDPVFAEYAYIITSRLELHGAWFFQVKRDRAGVLKLLEVAPRISGTSAVQRVRGVNLPLLSLYEQERRPIEILPNQGGVVIDRALVNRYMHTLRYDTVYVDLDDTLILKDKVNAQLVSFLYQCVNKKIRLVLVTKHAGDPMATLRRHRLGLLFDEVIHLNPTESKAAAIHGDAARAIFIDDSFAERKEVTQRLGLPSFDCSMVEALLDDRC